MMRRWLVLCACASALATMPAARAEIRAGAAVRVITPEKYLPVSGGMGTPKPSREKRGELTARVLVLRKGDVSVAVVALDLLGFPSVLGDRVRAKVPRIPAENILIGSTHTHSAPDCYAFPDGQGGHTGDLVYMDFVCDKAAEAINEAIDRLQPAWIKVATGEARGKIAYNYYAPDLYDRRMSVIQAVTLEGKTIATLVNYAVHPEVLGNSVGIISPDLVGPLCERIESQAGGVALFMNGAQGGMVTADNRNLDQPRDPQRGYWNDARTWEECLRIGHLMAGEALRIVKDAPDQKDPRLLCESITVRFPVESDNLWAVVLHSPLKYPHGEDRSIRTRINLVNLGDAQILTIPGEALPNIGFYLKRKMRGKHNLLFGLTNDAFGYILTKVDFASFPRYEYVSRTSLGEMTGEILIEKSLDLVKRSPAPDDDAPARKADDLHGRVQALVQPMLEKKKSVGVVVGVIEGGRTRVFGFGRTVLGGDKVPDGKTIFEIGSVTKVFTSLALADMAEEGLVRLDDPVQRYLPGEVKVASRSGREITLEDLATHTSGLPRIPGTMIVLALKNPQDPYANYKEKDLYGFFKTWKPTRDIGSEFEYSNLGAGLLGHALSRRAGLDYGRLIATRISERLGMGDTKVTLNDEQEKRVARPYEAGGKPASRWTLDVLAGAGALHSTVDDLLVFLSTEMGIKESKLRPAMEVTQKPRREAGKGGMRIGLAWLMMKFPKTDQEIIWHNGGTGGYRSIVGFVKATKTAVVVLSNSDASVDSIGLDVLRLLNAKEDRPE
jgi:CubicO group peptidase (beta-lactamase class C family)